MFTHIHDADTMAARVVHGIAAWDRPTSLFFDLFATFSEKRGNLEGNRFW